MKVILLAGGFGTRLSEYTETIPKPMVMIGDKPIIWHIMHRYSLFGHKEFILALGYKQAAFKDYFLNYKILNSDFSINLENSEINLHNKQKIDWNVNLISTGINTMTGGRVKRVEKYTDGETCLLTYGDGLSDVNIDELIDFHKSHGKLVTMTAVRPNARFGELQISGNTITSFEEKPQTNQGWINGGFFVLEPEFFKLIDSDETVLEKEPLEKACELNELMAYKHEGFWQCMDTKRDWQILEDHYRSTNVPWLIK